MKNQTVQGLVEWIAAQIHAGVWPPGARLPAERQLAEQRGVHRSTAAAAYAELGARGLVEPRRGSGTFVTGDLWGVAPDWTRSLNGSAFRPTEPLLRRVHEARMRPDIVDFSQADPGIENYPHALLREASEAAMGKTGWGYAPIAGVPALREAIARYAQARCSVPVAPESVLVTAGAQQALYLMARAVLRPGDAIAIEQPSYYYSLSLFQSSGIRLFPVQTDGEGILPDALDAVIRRHRPAMVWLNPTYHNPTSASMSLERRAAALELCRRWNTPVVEDDAFSDLRVAGAPPAAPPLKSLDPQRVVYVGTLSKIAAPGLRIGWLIAPDPLLRRLSDAKGQMDLGAPRLTQAVAAELLDHPGWPDHVAAVQKRLRVRRDQFIRLLEPGAGRGLSWRVPEGGLYLWVRTPGPGDDRIRLDAAVQRGILYSPGRIYGAGDGFARLNYTWPSEDSTTSAAESLVDILSAT